VTPRKKHFLDALEVLSTSAIGAWLYFVPIFWDMTMGVYGYPSAIKQVFFENNNPEFFIGGGIDQLGTVWVFTMAKGIFLFQHDSILSQIYFPYGFDLGLNTGFGWADALLSLPLMVVLDTPGFYNAHVFFTLMLSMLGMQILFRLLGAPKLVALGIALAGLMTPFGFHEIYEGRPTQVHWFFHCIFLCSILKGQGHNWLRWSFIGGLSLVGACMTYWFSGAAIGFCGAIVLIVRWLTRPNMRDIAFGSSLAFFAFGIGVFLTSRVSIPILKGEGSSLFTQLAKSPLMTIDTGIIPIPIQSLSHIESWSGLIDLANTLPIAPLHWLLFGSIFLSLRFKKLFPWALGLIIAIGIPLTPALQWKGGMLPTGHALFHAVFPPLPRCEFPLRMMVAPLLIGLCLSAATIGAWYRKSRNPLLRQSFSLGLGLLIIWGALANRPTEGVVGNFQYDGDLIKATRNIPGGIIDVPLERSQNTYVQQIYHQQPILGGPGMNRVRPKGHEEYVESSAYLRGLEKLAVGEAPPTPPPTSIQNLWNDGFRWIVVHTQLVQSSPEDFEAYIGGQGKLDMRTRQLIIPIPKPEDIK
jgi:hypothetical protein